MPLVNATRVLLHTLHQEVLPLDVQLGSGSALDEGLVGRQLLLQNTTLAAEALDNLDRAANVEAGVQHGVDLAPDGLEVVGLLDSLTVIIC